MHNPKFVFWSSGRRSGGSLPGFRLEVARKMLELGVCQGKSRDRARENDPLQTQPTAQKRPSKRPGGAPGGPERPPETTGGPACGGPVVSLNKNKTSENSAQNPKTNRVRWMPAQAGGGKNKVTHQFLVCWARDLCRRKKCRPPAPGCAGVPFLHATSSRRAARHPNPQTSGLQLYSLNRNP